MSFFKPNIQKMRVKNDVGGLVKALNHSDQRIRDDAYKALITIGIPAIKELQVALHDKNNPGRQHVVKVLANIGDPQVIEPLTLALKDKDWVVRQHAADGLGCFAELRVVKALISTLRDHDPLYCYKC
jgi:HEAT repeat protein